jgi:hypothetical protein
MFAKYFYILRCFAIVRSLFETCLHNQMGLTKSKFLPDTNSEMLQTVERAITLVRQ